MNFDERPLIAFWEMNRDCAHPERDDLELTSSEAKHLLEQLARARVPNVMLGGRDPARRPDLLELVDYGRRLGLKMGLTPSPTLLLSGALLKELAGAGLSRLAVSVDGPDAESHDTFRNTPGSFEHAEHLLGMARELDVKAQVDTSLHARNADCLRDIARLVATTGAVLWNVAFAIPTGRADAAFLLSPRIVEVCLEDLATIAEGSRFAIQTTDAPHFRRVLSERKRRRGDGSVHDLRRLASARVNDGRGLLFVSHQGEIYPSGSLPLPCGNVRSGEPLHVYRHHPLFRWLRDDSRLHGKCGSCEYGRLCGGSRARAYALTADPLASDPSCAYMPAGYVERQPRRLPLVS